MQIPWRLKSAAFSIVDVIGAKPLYFAQRRITRRAAPRGGKISPNWVFHRNNIQEHGAKRVIEFGAGKDLAQNLFLSAAGVEQTVVDLFPMIEIELVNAAIDNLRDAGVPMGKNVSSKEDLADKYGITYKAPLDMARSGFEAQSFDACISTNTLEHIPEDVIRGIWAECGRVLSPGGILSHKIDYSDHYSHTDKSISELNYLRFTREKWARHNHRNHFQNRLRHRHHLALLTEAGFKVVFDEAKDYALKPIEALAENLTGDPTDYAQTGFILARKS